jgi:hypothetical protein
MSTTSPSRIRADIPPIVFDVPAGTDLLSGPPPAAPLADPTRGIAQALLTPRGTPPLAQVVAAASPAKAPAYKTAVLVVSDITRPDVPYTGPAGLIYCTTGISPGDLEKLPLTSGYAYTGETCLDLMVQRALQRLLAAWQQRLGRLPRLGVIRDGAHAIPQLMVASRAV